MGVSQRDLFLAAAGITNYVLKRPFCASFEITRNCNARCQHCHLGAPIAETHAPPEVFGRIARDLKPLVVTISGGEPLMREDVEAIIGAVRRPGRAPLMLLTTNGSLLTRERFSRLVEVGMDHFVISCDYPDDRHDVYRKIPGLFGHLSDLVASLDDDGRRRITLACVIQSDNLASLMEMAELARRWGVRLSVSAYTYMRTNDHGMMIPPERMAELRATMAALLEHKRRHRLIRTSDYVLEKTIEYFDKGEMPNCRAGQRYLVVNPDGTFSPCGLIVKDYPTQKDLVREFTRKSPCAACYTASRANSERPLKYLLLDNARSRAH
jgi:MoaA/NifB/PqqE/SkfB family radical SAM enzyme